MKGYAYYAHWSKDDGEWVGTCPDFPSLSWLDGKASGALDGIKRLAADIARGFGPDGIVRHYE